jgi:Flp pilus assembly protein TadD
MSGVAPPSNVSTTMQRQVQNAAYVGEGDPEIRALRKRLAANATDLDARITLARLYTQRNLPDLALEHYRVAALQFPDSIVVALNLATTLREMGEEREALKSAQEFLDRHPNGSWEMLALIGIIEDDRGDYAAAEKAHRAALVLDANRSSLHNNLGYNLLLQQRPDPATEEFRRAIELDPHSEIAHNNLATALAAQSRSREAIAEWQNLAGAAAAHNNLAAVLIDQGRYAEARAELELALGARRDFAPALANLQLVAERDGNPATLPPATAHVNLWKRFTSTFGAVLGSSRAAAAVEGK